VDHFKELTKNMTMEQVMSLVSDPACPGNLRQHFYNSYFYNYKKNGLSRSILDKVILVEIQNDIIRNDVFKKRCKLLLRSKNVS